MQTILLEVPTLDREAAAYLRAALRECIAYGEHGVEIETAEDGHEVCFNCGQTL